MAYLSWKGLAESAAIVKLHDLRPAFEWNKTGLQISEEPSLKSVNHLFGKKKRDKNKVK